MSEWVPDNGMVDEGDEEERPPEQDVGGRYYEEHFDPLDAVTFHPAQVFPHASVFLEGAARLKIAGGV